MCALVTQSLSLSRSLSFSLLSAVIMSDAELSPLSIWGLSSDMAFLRVRCLPSLLSLAGNSHWGLWMVSTPTTLCLWYLKERRPFSAGGMVSGTFSGPWKGREIKGRGATWTLRVCIPHIHRHQLLLTYVTCTHSARPLSLTQGPGLLASTEVHCGPRHRELEVRGVEARSGMHSHLRGQRSCRKAGQMGQN